MENITYLFGAGASSNCLPIYSNFNSRFIEFREFIKSNIHELGTLKDSERKLKQAVTFYNEELKFHTTPDTYAKKLFHTKSKQELNNFKIILIMFFLFEQLQNFVNQVGTTNLDKQLFDKRYDAFIAALLKPKPGEVEFLENVTVLTWNYDLQFEIAYKQYVQKDIHSIQTDLQCYPILKEGFSFRSLKANNKFSLIHLNGIAYPNINLTNDLETKIGSFYSDKKELGQFLLKIYDSILTEQEDSAVSNLSFAWENIDEDYQMRNDYLSRAREVIRKTEILVINGYSFPIFNRSIDAELIQNMKSLKGIYIQDKYAAENIKQIIESFVGHDLKNKIVDLGYYNQFYIPEMFIKTPPPINLSGMFF